VRLQSFFFTAVYAETNTRRGRWERNQFFFADTFEKENFRRIYSAISMVKSNLDSVHVVGYAVRLQSFFFIAGGAEANARLGRCVWIMILC
jgi:hypothetical protein